MLEVVCFFFLAFAVVSSSWCELEAFFLWSIPYAAGVVMGSGSKSQVWVRFTLSMGSVSLLRVEYQKVRFFILGFWVFGFWWPKFTLGCGLGILFLGLGWISITKRSSSGFWFFGFGYPSLCQCMLVSIYTWIHRRRRTSAWKLTKCSLQTKRVIGLQKGRKDHTYKTVHQNTKPE